MAVNERRIQGSVATQVLQRSGNLLPFARRDKRCSGPQTGERISNRSRRVGTRRRWPRRRSRTDTVLSACRARQRDVRLLRTSRREPWLLWLKSRGIPTPWLAPRTFASRFLDLADDQETDATEIEGDVGDVADDEEGSVVEMSGEQFDDLLRGVSQLPEERAMREALSSVDRGLTRRVCGGYVALLDAALGRLLEQIDHDAATSPTLLVVTAGQGLTVREPGKLTNDCALLAEETIHTPLFIRLPNPSPRSRRQELVQTVDLLPTLAEWFGVDVSAIPLDGQSLMPLRAVKRDLNDQSRSRSPARR